MDNGLELKTPKNNKPYPNWAQNLPLGKKGSQNEIQNKQNNKTKTQ